MKDKRGFSLMEFMLVIVALFIITTTVFPLILYAVKTFRINAFKSSADNILDSVKYYIVNNNFISLPEDGVEIRELDLELENNNFDSGLIKPIDDNNFELVYLRKDNYCAKGSLGDIKVTDQGCGALDETAPEQVYVYLKDSAESNITVIASAIENDSEIKFYEFSIDGKKYTEKSPINEYTFEKLEPGKHKIKARVTNEAGLTKTSTSYEFELKENINITCQEADNIHGISSLKNVVCSYPNGYDYEYSLDNQSWSKLYVEEGLYTFKFDSNKTVYTRILKNNEVVYKTSITVSNIDSTLNGAYPELLDNMIAVTYDENKGVWIKANPSQIYWNYENKTWANAVLVRNYKDSSDSNSHSRSYYLSDEAIGKEIYEKDILGFYVWIPRYRYSLFNVANKTINPTEIVIQFESKDIEKSSGKIDDTYANNVWYTHPAFSYNNELNGFWVSKFKNSVSKDTNCYLYKDANNCNSENIIVYSMPDSNPVTNISISNAHLVATKMTSKNNIYGLEGNAHIVTNLEWGAIAYLTQSKYGSNQNLSSNQKNYKNNLNSSTTNNITGVFDMASGTSEMVMANYNKDAGLDEKNNSGFKDLGQIDWPDTIDYYNGITYKNRILGDAIGETINWYGSINNFVNGEYPFIIRGGTMDSISSIYNYDKWTGSASNITLRTVLTQK